MREEKSQSDYRATMRILIGKDLAMRLRLTSRPRLHNSIQVQSRGMLVNFPRRERHFCNPNKVSMRFVSSKVDPKKDAKSEDTSQTLWQQVCSPPNVITITRMASTPLLAYWIVSEQYLFAVGGCALAAFSDYLDGYLAKRYGWTTVLGTYLDPLADKAFVNTVGISLWYSGVLPAPLIAFWATKDVLLLSGTAWYLFQKNGSIGILSNSVAKEPLKVTPSMIAKVNTTLQFSTLFVGILSPVIPMPPLLLDSLCWITGGTTVGSAVSYASKSGVAGDSLTSRGRLK